MPIIKITIQSVQKAAGNGAGDAIYRDQIVKGFSLKVTPSNNKIFFFQYRVGGRAGITRKIKIGLFPVIKPDDARRLASEYAGEVAKKQDPYERLKQEASSKLKARENSFGKLFEIYNHKRLSQNRSGAEVKRIFEREFFPSLENTAISSVSRGDISKIINKIYERDARYESNRALSFVKTYFRWAVGEGYLQGDPTSGMQKPFKNEEARTRVLTEPEIKLLWKQFDNLKYPFGYALKLLLLTGQRREEVSGMRWDDLKLDQGLWSIPRESTKNKLTHVVPLLGSTLDIIKTQPRLTSSSEDKTSRAEAKAIFVFTTTGKTPISGWSKIKDRITERLAEDNVVIDDWRIHDLRRTMSSYMGDMGYHDNDIGMLLNHQSRGVTAIYNRSTYLDKKREMLGKWDARLMKITGQI